MEKRGKEENFHIILLYLQMSKEAIERKSVCYAKHYDRPIQKST